MPSPDSGQDDAAPAAQTAARQLVQPATPAAAFPTPESGQLTHASSPAALARTASTPRTEAINAPAQPAHQRYTPMTLTAAAPSQSTSEVQRSFKAVEVPPPPASIPVSMPPAPAQREFSPPAAAYGQIQREATVEPTPQQSGQAQTKSLDFDKIAEEVWPRIRRKLRIERERERGLHS